MAEEKKNWLGPYIPEGSWLREMIQQAKLAYNLMLDRRVPALAKLIPIGAVAYLFFPFDLSPDVVPLLGQLDDVGIMLLGFRLFFEFSPPEVVREHLKRLAQTVRGNWNVVDDAPPPPTNDGNVVDGKFRDEK
jgi:uncharacterized membrane protein YkvA (DUF1232 family)